MKLEIELLDSGSFLYKNYIIASWSNGIGDIFYDAFEAKTNIPLVLNKSSMKEVIEEAAAKRNKEKKQQQQGSSS